MLKVLEKSIFEARLRRWTALRWTTQSLFFLFRPECRALFLSARSWLFLVLSVVYGVDTM